MSEHILALAGGVGGAKLALGLARLLPPGLLTIAVNTGDDEQFHGLPVSPDLDTVMYTLAGVANPETGWGRAGDTFTVLSELNRLGADTWFNLGDRDIALHLRRRELLSRGLTLSQATAELCRAFGVLHLITPMTDEPVRTVVETDAGSMSFQEYFVRRRCEPCLTGLAFEGAAAARPAPAFAQALDEAGAVIFCPSNPFLSIDPILALPTVRERLGRNGRRIAVVSPIVAGEAVRGPAAKLFHELAGEEPSCVAVARHYKGIANRFVLDRLDAAREEEVQALGFRTLVAQTMMRSDADKLDLARSICDWLGVET